MDTVVNLSFVSVNVLLCADSEAGQRSDGFAEGYVGGNAVGVRITPLFAEVGAPQSGIEQTVGTFAELN
jgi:hypothetical protein